MVTINNVAPTVTLSALNDLDVAEGSTTTYTFSIFDPGDDTVTAVTVDCGANGDPATNVTFTDTTGSFDCTFPDGDALSTISASATDSDGDTGAADTQVVTINNVAPTTPNLLAPPDGTITNDATPTFDWSDSTDPAGANDTISYSIQADNDGCLFPSPEVGEVGLAASTFTPSTNLADGTYCWRGNASDEDGGTSAYSSTRMVIIDTTVPTGSITINSNATYTNATSVTLNLNATDLNGIVSYRVANGADCSSATFVAPFTAVSPYSANVSHTLPSGDGTKTVCVQYRDAAGNVSTTSTDSIILDQTVPTGSITINSNATYTNATSVTLNLNATDLNGIVSYRVANGADCSSATFVAPFTAVSPYSADVSHTLPSGDGTKTVCVQYRDAAGNVSTTSTDSIILDQTVPNVTITDPDHGITYTALTWNAGCGTTFVGDFCGTASDALSGLSSVHYSIQRVSDSKFWNGTSFSSSTEVFLTPTGLASWTQAFAYGNFPATGLYTLKARATDVAGNTKTVSATFTINNPSGGIYVFEGFFQPIDNVLLNKANAGSTVPVKWRITLNGVAVSDPNSFVALTSRLVDCGTLVGLPVDDIETYSTNSGLQYTGNGSWHFNWKTPKSYANECRIMTLTLNDGSTHDADFKFK